MANADVLVREYVARGLSQDPSRLLDGLRATIRRRCPKTLVAARAARLCAVAESALARGGRRAPVYVIGTEVPTPGGATEDCTSWR